MSFRLAGTRNVIKRISLFKSFFFDGKTPKLKQKTQTVVFLRPEKKNLKKNCLPNNKFPPGFAARQAAARFEAPSRNPRELGDAWWRRPGRAKPLEPAALFEKKGNQGMKLGDDWNWKDPGNFVFFLFFLVSSILGRLSHGFNEELKRIFPAILAMKM